jgi:hypothetical protein
MSYLLTMSIHCQRNGKQRTNWPPVLELVNATFTRFPSFVLAYPNGLEHPNILSVQYKERHRADGVGSRDHRVRPKAWVLAQDLCTPAEMREFMGYVEDLIEAERVLSLKPDSSVIRNTEDPRVYWIVFNVARSMQERQVTYYQSPSSEAEDGNFRVQRGHQEMEDGEMGQQHEIADGESMEHEEEQDEQTSAGIAVSSSSRFVPAKSSLQPTARANLLIGGAPSTDGTLSGTSTRNTEFHHSSGNTHSTAYYATSGASGRTSVAQRPSSQDLSSSLDGVEARDLLSAEINFKAREGLIKLIEKLHSWPELAIVHTKKVDFTTGKPIVVIQAASFKRKQAEEVFVGSASPVYSFAGRVYKMEFRDEVTGQSVEVDTLLCSEKFCATCNSANECLAEAMSLMPRQRPVIHEGDMVMIPRQGPTFAPGGQAREANDTPFEHSYVLYVVFSGLKRFLVDVAY